MHVPGSAAQPFSVVAVPERGEVVVVLTGELDLASADLLEREVRRCRVAGGDCVVVDLRHVAFIDSTGLRLLISLRNTAQRERHRLIVVPGPHRVQRIFDLTGTRGLFDWRE
jgi:anti-sigma B factor antagonist